METTKGRADTKSEEEGTGERRCSYAAWAGESQK